MSIVPEEGSILSNTTNTNNDTNAAIQDYKTKAGNIDVNPILPKEGSTLHFIFREIDTKDNVLNLILYRW